MNVFSYFHAEIAGALGRLAAEGKLPAGLDLAKLVVEPPRDAAHGDLSTNAAMVLTKQVGKPPRAIAELLVAALRAHPAVTEATIAGPGFLNWRLKDDFWQERLKDILAVGPAYGASDIGRGTKINVEYVSANPTGPMHVGHARGAVFGDALASLLAKAGFDVCREYYINDAGAQVDVLARSAYLRYREALGEAIGEIPQGLYPGEYLKAAGQALVQCYGDKWLGKDESEWLVPVRDVAIETMLAMIKDDLASLGVRHDVFTSERALHASGAIDKALATLEAAGLIYVGVLEPPKGKTPDDWEPRPQTLFAASRFGDDVDRPLKKSDGAWTYFAADIAYHLDKYRRGFAQQIDVLGADHGGYVKRMQAAVTAITNGGGSLDVKICQLVQLLDNGEPVKMSKRSGTFVTLREVVEEVGKDIVRFMMLTRKNDQTLDFDFAKVVDQSRDNMVWYVQYAHARAQSVLRKARAEDPAADLADQALAAADLTPLVDPSELALIRQLAGWPRLIESAAEAHEPHRLAFYLYEIAAQFHALWNKGKDDASLRFVLAGDTRTTLARLALVQAVGFVIASGLDVFGVAPVMELR
ncbi:arginine--tRNA ligase [Aliidongia dinghuensis]|uniref:Arginine--tRNA ligase n=1 Tax=Aliidongia dinghuensis TaxID=1867774 RepID=A0A8J2YSZ0_9PROT|nr:arginine--tRNA ligase [Aliidongia dinghuensis]GGF13667.1 arginine--tRNA ligase [Aliidongia dinghuensis]